LEENKAAASTAAGEDLTFETPPVFEVVLSVQFEAVPMTAAHFGLFWAGVRDRYPSAIEQPPIEAVEESFQRVQVDKKPTIRVLEKPDTPRMWFLSGDGTELIQLQSNRFVRNWRQNVPGAAYPRYSALRERFARDFLLFVDFVEREGLGDIRPTQVEITYINHVPSATGEEHTRPGRHFRIGEVPQLFPGDEPEDVRLIARWVMRHEDRPVGRLHVDLRPAYKGDAHEPVWTLNLVARGAPTSATGVEAILQFMDLGRARILRAFDVLTTEEMHLLWQKR
jgi:uncharacterized protein (TIGR04255 family)